MSRKLEQKQQRRLAEEQRRKETKRAARRRNLSFAIVILLVAGLVVGLIVSERLGESDTGGEPVGTTASRAGCTEAQKSPEEGHEHVPVGTQVDYETTPPTSGNHYPPPAPPAGFYPPDAAGAIPDEGLVHNLEHGQIVFWYDPDAPGVADDLQDLIDKQPARYAQALVAAPYDMVPDGFTFTMTSWTFSSSCKAVSEEAINEFRADHQGVDGREQFTPPFTP